MKALDTRKNKPQHKQIRLRKLESIQNLTQEKRTTKANNSKIPNLKNKNPPLPSH
jgi:hypothetical protein